MAGDTRLMYHVDLTPLQVFMYVSVHGAFRYGITAPFHHPQLDPPPPRPQQRLQGKEDQDQLPQRVSPSAQGYLAARATNNQVRKRRTNEDQQMASMERVETLRTAERHEHEDADAQLGDAEQSLSNESDLTGAGANANTARTEDTAANSDAHHFQAYQVIVSKQQLKKEAANLKRAPKPPAEEQPSQTGTQVTFNSKSNLIFSEYLTFSIVINCFSVAHMPLGWVSPDKPVNDPMKPIFSIWIKTDQLVFS